MDSKFYVSYEAARLLKEKGYKRSVNRYYSENGFLHDLTYDENYDYHMSNNDLDLDHYAAPTKAEAIDWLESKGIVIIVNGYYIKHEEDDYYTSCWGFYIRKNNECVCRDYSSDFSTRLEAEEVAIIKALELYERSK